MDFGKRRRTRAQEALYLKEEYFKRRRIDNGGGGSERSEMSEMSEEVVGEHSRKSEESSASDVRVRDSVNGRFEEGSDDVSVHDLGSEKENEGLARRIEKEVEAVINLSSDEEGAVSVEEESESSSSDEVSDDDGDDDSDDDSDDYVEVLERGKGRKNDGGTDEGGVKRKMVSDGNGDSEGGSVAKRARSCEVVVSSSSAEEDGDGEGTDTTDLVDEFLERERGKRDEGDGSGVKIGSKRKFSDANHSGSVAQRTRLRMSCSIGNKKKLDEFGTISRPICENVINTS